ncbi:uncharacterized protein G2W53_032902 [Senna tora]|uniref:Uncharacterized protein n=1 Tax=Senna tora TaxID=362788 RepID=A0A834WAK0_9FABA|nr:uncharacterized protein G2W53_032902 [Senna tora]
MRRVSSNRVGSTGAGPSSVKKEPISLPGPPPGFGLLVEKDQEEKEDNEDDPF